MNLSDYLANYGATNGLAKAINAHPVLVSQWKTGARQVPAERCPDIEAATGGKVRCEELRPDVNWSVLRKVGASETANG